MKHLQKFENFKLNESWKEMFFDRGEYDNLDDKQKINYLDDVIDSLLNSATLVLHEHGYDFDPEDEWMSKMIKGDDIIDMDDYRNIINAIEELDPKLYAEINEALDELRKLDPEFK